MDELHGVWRSISENWVTAHLAVSRAGSWWEAASWTPDDWAKALATTLAPPQLRRWLDRPPVRSRGQLIRRGTDAYPAVLESLQKDDLLESPPPLLFVEGDVDVLHRDMVGIVGTRRCTPDAAVSARRLGLQLAAAGIPVVSGLARGVDGQAHRGAVDGGQTVAVLGHGLGTTSPRSHHHLRRRIVETGGAVVALWPDDMQPTRWSFPRRNHVIAALSTLGLVVVQAPEQSGALITAERAEELGRAIFAVPSLVGAVAAGSTWWLDKRRATPITCVDTFCRERGGEAWGVEPWLAALFQGKDLSRVAEAFDTTELELLMRLGRLEEEGLVRRLPGFRFAPARPPR